MFACRSYRLAQHMNCWIWFLCVCCKVLKLKSDASVYVRVTCLVLSCPFQERFCLCKLVCQRELVQIKVNPYGIEAREKGNYKNKKKVVLQGSSALQR